MSRPRLLGVLAVLTCLVGLAAAPPAQATGELAGVAGLGRALPRQVFAPYFETYAGSNLAALARQSGAGYLTLAFLESTGKGSCTLAWNGDPATPAAWSTFGPDIARIRARGGDVIPSFGGYSADHGGTDIAESCTSVPRIAAAYEQVVTTYGVTRLDLDVEDNALNRPRSIDRRNRAIQLVEAWAAARGRTVQFSYTLPTGTAGLDPTSVALLENAKGHGVQVRVVNIMTFDYYDGASHEMARDTRTAAGAVIAQLRAIYPHQSEAALWSRLGITEMIGIDDFGLAETFTLADARAVRIWAAGKGVATLSYWALQRDNGGCPGTAGQRQLLGRHAGPLAVQPRLRAIHQLTAPLPFSGLAGSGRARPAPRTGNAPRPARRRSAGCEVRRTWPPAGRRR
jgi:chitinase